MEIPGLETLILPHTGSIASIRPTAEGNMSDLTAIVDCENGPVFVKVMANKAGGRRESLYRERDIAPHVRDVSPALLWTAEDDTWTVLAFEALEGRTSDFRPGSGDVDVVVEMLRRVGEIPLPAVARDWPETRWDQWAAGPHEASLFQGDALLYTDIHEGNFLIGKSRSWVVDWSWPTRGAAFIDPASLILQLIAAGHSPAGAEALAGRLPAWREADPAAVDAFVAAELRKRVALVERKPDVRWLKAMLLATEEWDAYRRGAYGPPA